MNDKPAKRGGFFSAFRRTAPAEVPATETVEAVELPPPDVQQPLVVTEPDAAPSPADIAPETAEQQPPAKRGWFQRLKAGLTKTSSRLSQDIAGIFTKRKLDAACALRSASAFSVSSSSRLPSNSAARTGAGTRRRTNRGAKRCMARVGC